MEIFIEWINDQVQNYLPKHQLFGLLAQFIAQSPGPLVHFRNFLEASKKPKKHFIYVKLSKKIYQRIQLNCVNPSKTIFQINHLGQNKKVQFVVLRVILPPFDLLTKMTIGRLSVKRHN